jgi:hypothetical protein
MSVAIQINNIDASGSGDIFVEGLLVPSGTYTNGQGGDNVDFSGVNSTVTLGANFSGNAASITSALLKQLWIGSMAGNLAFQYVANIISGITAKMKVSASATFGTELGTGAYPAGVTGDVIGFQATFKKNQ